MENLKIIKPYSKEETFTVTHTSKNFLTFSVWFAKFLNLPDGVRIVLAEDEGHNVYLRTAKLGEEAISSSLFINGTNTWYFQLPDTFTAPSKAIQYKAVEHDGWFEIKDFKKQ